MDKNSIQHNNILKFKKNRVIDKKLRQFDNKLHRINKKIDLISQSTFILNREKKELNEKTKKPYLAAKLHRAETIIKKIKNLVIKINIFILYIYFKRLNNKKNNLNKKISKLIQL